MKKKLLMAAVGAALVAGPMVAAHAAGATLYGHVHLSMDRIDNGGNGDYVIINSSGAESIGSSGDVERGFMSNNSTRIGIKGDEDLGGGLKAIYQIESGSLGIDDATNGFGGDLRNSFVGFAGSWGTVKLGRYDTPYKDLGRKLDNFNEQVGDARNIIGDGAVLSNNSVSAAFIGEVGAGSWDQRTKNAIRYESPNMSGITANFLYSGNNGADETAAGTQSTKSLGVNWSSGPLFLGFGWEEHSTGSSDAETGMRLAGSFTFNNITLGAIYEMLEDIGGVGGLEKTVLGIMGAATMGNNKFKAHWYDMDELEDDAGTLDGTGGSLWALGVDHTFSKTAMVYFNYAKADNDDNFNLVGVTSGNGGHGETVFVGAGKSPQAYSVGTIIKF
jgi:predicted porin